MSHYTTTIRSFLLSHFVDDNGIKNGYGLDDNGNFFHYNKIINNTYNKLFEDMQLNPYVTDEFKKEFCKRFYNDEIGFEVFSQFQIQLESYLNNECYNLLKFMDKLRNISIEDGLKSMDITTKSNAKGDAQNLALVENKPEKRLNILYPNKKGVIEYANNIAENHSQQEQNNWSNTTGYTGQNIFDELNQFASYSDLQTQVFNILDNLFLRLY